MYYSLSWATGRRGAALGLIAGTRTFGHTILLTAAVAAFGAARKSRTLAALALGMATHLVLDIVTDLCMRPEDFTLRALAWPFLGWQFPASKLYGLREHVSTSIGPFMIAAEILGAAILVREWLRTRPHLSKG